MLDWTAARPWLLLAVVPFAVANSMGAPPDGYQSKLAAAVPEVIRLPPVVSSANYDVTADGKRFVMVKDKGQDAGSTSIVVALHWAEELNRLGRDGKK